MFKNHNLLLSLIIVLAATLRVVNLGSIPIGFNDDEAAFGYNAYSILKTGRDEWGRFLPFPAFESFGDWKLVSFLYLTVVTEFFFGLNEFAVRLPSAIIGVFAVFATYLLAKELFNQKIAVIASLFLAISPWHIVASRNAFESDILIFPITLATYFFLKGTKNPKFLTFSFITFSFCFYIYRSSWLFVPLFVFYLIYFFRRNLKKKIIFANILMMALILLPLVPVVTTFKGQSRFLQESFITGTSKIGIINEINEKRGICSTNLPSMFCIIIFNKYVSFAKTYITNYAQNLSFQAFFEKSNYTGFQSFASRGAFYLFEFPFLIIGFVAIFKIKSSAKVLIAWLLLAPIGASITGIGNYGRINLIMPAPQIISAFGLIVVINYLKSRLISVIFISVISVLILISMTRLMIEIFYIEPYYTSRYQRYGYKQLFDYLEKQKNIYNKIFISKKIDNSHQYIQYLFFQKIDPNFFLANAQREKENYGWVNVKSINSLNFVPSTPGIETIPPKSLIVVGEREVNYRLNPIFTINYLNGDIGFEVYDIDEVKLHEELK